LQKDHWLFSCFVKALVFLDILITISVLLIAKLSVDVSLNVSLLGNQYVRRETDKVIDVSLNVFLLGNQYAPSNAAFMVVYAQI